MRRGEKREGGEAAFPLLTPKTIKICHSERIRQLAEERRTELASSPKVIW